MVHYPEHVGGYLLVTIVVTLLPHICSPLDCVHIWINWALDDSIFLVDLVYPGVKYYDHIITLMFDHLTDQMDMVTKVTAGQLQL